MSEVRSQSKRNFQNVIGNIVAHAPAEENLGENKSPKRFQCISQKAKRVLKKIGPPFSSNLQNCDKVAQNPFQTKQSDIFPTSPAARLITGFCVIIIFI